MKCHLPLLVGWMLLYATVAVMADPAGVSHADSFSREGLLKADVAQLKDTRMVATPDAALVPGQNVLWCGTLQLAWNEAIALVGEKLHFNRPSPEVQQLNRMDFTRNDLDPGSYVAIADFERNHVEAQIRAALEKTFHGAASPELIPPVPAHPAPEDFVAYAYLYKDLAFALPFEAGKPLHFEGKAVKAFGFDTDSPLPRGTVQQAGICDYRSPEDFIVELKTKSPGDELILAKIAPGATLQATIAGVLARVAQHPATPAGNWDRMVVPKLNFDLQRNFDELKGLILIPSPQAKIKGKLRVTEVKQIVRFQLNEKGAILKSEAVMTMKALAMMPGHSMIFDRPFLILMKQADAPRPYFALWVGNASLLMPDGG